MTSCQDLRGQPWRESWAKAMSMAYTFFNQSSLSFLVTLWPNQPETDLGHNHQGSQFDTGVVTT